MKSAAITTGMTLLLAALAVSPVGAENTRITPGQSIGEIRLGDSRAAVRRKLGKPSKTFTSHGRRAVDHWERQSALDEVEVVYEGDKACQIEVSADRYKTVSGLSPAGTLASVKSVYPKLRSTFYLYNTEDGKGLEYYDDIRRGIAFVFTSPDTKTPQEKGIRTVLVHRPGRRAIPTLIKDLTNVATGGDADPLPLSRAEQRRLNSCRRFVQAFYTGYLREFSKEHSMEELETRYRPSALSRALRRRLHEDYVANTNSKGEIVGLDFDPILAAQDSAERHVVGNVYRTGNTYRAEVYSYWNGKKNKTPSVVPELVYERGRWVFVNFHYDFDNKPGTRRDLLQLLKELREDRKKPK
jgi:hypothetical protein